MSDESQRQAGALVSEFLSRSLALTGRVDTSWPVGAGKRRDKVKSDEELHEVESSVVERERFEFDLIDGHWA